MNFFPLSDQNLHDVFSFLAGQETFIFLETGKTDRENHNSYIFTNPVAELIIRGNEPVDSFFLEAEHYLKQGYYLAGWSAYELGYSLEKTLKNLRQKKKKEIIGRFGVFPTPVIFSHQTGEFNQTLSHHKASNKWRDKNPVAIRNIHPNQSKADYLKKIRKIKDYITAGDTYQVNYTLKLFFDFQGNPDDLYETLRRSQSVSYGAYMKFGDTITLSFSPELFFRKKNTNCTVRPMKGTAGRGRTFDEDKAMAARLQKDTKNRSENVMIVDLLRNDLGRLAAPGSIETESLFDIETYRTLHQMTSTINGTLDRGIGLHELFKAMFPCGSVTGAPKIRTMEIIHELELEARGIYTGAIGFVTPTKDMVFNVPIRTLTLHKERGEMGIGSGIVHDSDPKNEWQECLLKGRFLTERPPEFQLIETFLWTPQDGYWLFKLHMERLQKSAEYFQYTSNLDKIETNLHELAKIFRAESRPTSHQKGQRIRLLLHKNGHFTTSQNSCPVPSEMQLPVSLDNNTSSSDTTSPLRAKLSKFRTDQNSPYLYHKTTLREYYNKERQTALEEGFQEIIFQNQKNEITEGSISNIIIHKDSRYFTPPVQSGLLPGTMRNYLLECFPQLLAEKILYQKDLETADAIYLINSVRGLVRYSC